MGAPGPGLPARFHVAVGERPVYVHLDCDVLAPGVVPTEYAVPDGLTLDELHAACAALAVGEVVGLEVAEFEATWRASASSDGGVPSDAPTHVRSSRRSHRCCRPADDPSPLRRRRRAVANGV